MRMVVLAAGAGNRLRAETGGSPKQLLDVAGTTILGRLLGLGNELGLAPLVVTRADQAARFAAAGLEVLAVHETPDMLATLHGARPRIEEEEDFVWIGGDTLLTDAEPIRELLAAHLAEGAYASFLYRRSNRHLAKLALSSPVPTCMLTRTVAFPYSLPNFGIQCAASLSDLAIEPRGAYVQRLLDRGERVRFREYTAPVFEIDTPEELAEARRHYSRCSTC
jgi:NDP-sugar pyrophosphorylase family protein